MKKYNQKSKFNRDRDSQRSFSATCANCGKECTVPFKPNGRKPVLCDNCFGEQDGKSDRPKIKYKFDKNGKKDDSYKGGYSKRGDSDEMKAIKFRLEHIERKLDELLRHYK